MSDNLPTSPPPATAESSSRPLSVEELVRQKPPRLLNCVHCGICLDTCPTYRLTGDENNSPRGRLAVWRALAENRLSPSAVTDHYLEECVGCLACETACPAKVPYGEMLIEQKLARAQNGLSVDWRLKKIAALVKYPRLFQVAGLPVRLLRSMGIRAHKQLPVGDPAIGESTANYAVRMNERHAPTGARVALFTGCMMESVFREINFATVRVLIANGFRVVVPDGQTCCGAIHEHAGLLGKDALDQQNRAAFDGLGFAAILTNAAGCGLSLAHCIKSETQDILMFLNSLGELRQGQAVTDKTDFVYLDLPCHLYHGRKVHTPPEKVLAAIGLPWALAPDAERCCGSGGAYMVTHEKNANAIIDEKSSFLRETPHAAPTLATMNHVCLMQWSAAQSRGSIKKNVRIAHLVELLDSAYAHAGMYAR